MGSIPTIGTEAPDFELPDQAGRPVRLSAYRGRSEVLLVFYPRDETPVCTEELCAVRDLRLRFEGRGVSPLGLSINTVAEHARFAAAHRLDYPLLADAEGAVTRRYGLLGSLDGTPASQRITFRIDRAGVVREVVPLWDAQKPLKDLAAHTRQVLEHLPRLLESTDRPNGYEGSGASPGR
ncbi:MAG: peroxiredoxin family protein [Thermoplasmata archaeon]